MLLGGINLFLAVWNGALYATTGSPLCLIATIVCGIAAVMWLGE